MADVQILEELLSRYNFSGEVDAKEFLDKLLFEGDSSYITEFRAAFKDNFFIPVSKQFEKLYNNIKKKLESFDDEKLEKVTDPFGLSELSKKHESEIKDYENKMLEFLRKDFTTNQNIPNFSALENTDVGKIIEEPTKKIKETENEKNVGEQKGFLPTENVINFSEKTKVFFKDLFYGFGESFSKKIQINTDKKTEETGGFGFLKTIGSLLLATGVGSILVVAFWDKIKPWLESKLGTKLDFLDKFRGIVEGIGKFFTMGGVSLTFGGAFKIVGGVIKSFGDLIESGLSLAFKALFSGGGAAGEAAGDLAKTGTGLKGMLPRIAGGLFRGIGATVLRGIPLIGSLISFGFAYDRIFNKGDFLGGTIDLVGGLANLLPPPFGIVLSLGAAALNAFLDYKGITGEGSNKRISASIGNFFTGLGKTLMGIPFIANLVNGISGLWNVFSGISSGDYNTTKNGFELMKGIPYLDSISNLWLGLLEMGETGQSSGNKPTFSFGKMMSELKKKINKMILNWFPAGTMRNLAANFLGIESEEKTTEETPKTSEPRKGYETDEYLKNQQRMVDISKISDDRRKKGESTKLQDEYWEKLNNNRSRMFQNWLKKQQMDEFKNQQEQFFQDIPEEREKSENKFVNDMDFMFENPTASFEDGEIAPNKNTRVRVGNKVYKAAPNDTVSFQKPDGVLDKNLTRLANIMTRLDNSIKELNRTPSREGNNNNFSSINIAGGGGGGDSFATSTRDPIFNARLEWWKMNPVSRGVI